MAVAVKDELDAGVPCEVLYVFRMGAARKKDREAGMAQIVPAYIRQASPTQERLEMTIDDVLSVERSALARGEHKPVILPF